MQASTSGRETGQVHAKDLIIYITPTRSEMSALLGSQKDLRHAGAHPKGGLNELHDAEEGGQQVPFEGLTDSHTLHIHRCQALWLVGPPHRIEAFQRQHIHLLKQIFLSLLPICRCTLFQQDVWGGGLRRVG